MEYRKEVYPNGNIDEQYIGTPEEIIKLINNMGWNKKDKEELIYNQEDAIDFIRLRLKKEHEAEITEGLLRAILELEEDYMRSVGIIRD